MSSNRGLILVAAVVALLGGGAIFSGFMKGGGVGGGAKPFEIAALTPEKMTQAERAIDRVHDTDRKTIERVLEAQAKTLSAIGDAPVQRRKLCITGLLESKAPLEEVDPAAGLATELTSQCSVVVGWVEKLGAVFGSDPNAEKLQRIGKLWNKYFVKSEDLTRELSVEVETAILEFRARRHGFVSGLGGAGWSELQSQISGAEATLLGSAPAFTAAEVKQLTKAGRAPEGRFKTANPGKLARSLVDASFEEAASTMGLELDLAATKSAEARPVGAQAWVAAIARSVLAAAPQKNSPDAAATLEGAVRETLAVARREAEAALKRRLTEKLKAQQEAERRLLETAAPAVTPPAPASTGEFDTNAAAY